MRHVLTLDVGAPVLAAGTPLLAASAPLLVAGALMLGMFAFTQVPASHPLPTPANPTSANALITPAPDYFGSILTTR